MKLSSSAILACVAVAVSLSCEPKSRFLPDLPCFNAERLKTEPLVFGDLSPDATSPGGWSGMEVFFGVDSAGRLTARLRETGGASRRTRPVERVSYDASTDSLTLVYQGPGTTRFTRMYRPSCRRLAGFATYFRSPGEPGLVVEDTLPRIESP
jgi:hypothetical protein